MHKIGDRSSRLSDPSWKSGPTYPEPSAEDHLIHPEDVRGEVDGFGRDEADMVEGEPLVVIHDWNGCTRDGCDAAHERRVLFTTHPLSETNKRRLRAVSGSDSLAAYVSEHASRDGPETIRVDGIRIHAETVIDDEPSGPCYGHVEPDGEPKWRRV